MMASETDPTMVSGGTSGMGNATAAALAATGAPVAILDVAGAEPAGEPQVSPLMLPRSGLDAGGATTRPAVASPYSPAACRTNSR
jgi:NAD(P)-dependent dehydrogenase (short-subunit alcohol dehydrogenase family)